MKTNYSDDIWLYMEDRYRNHGASCDASQLILRSEHLTKMLKLFSEEKIVDMLKNNFYKYHTFFNYKENIY